MATRLAKRRCLTGTEEATPSKRGSARCNPSQRGDFLFGKGAPPKGFRCFGTSPPPSQRASFPPVRLTTPLRPPLSLRRSRRPVLIRGQCQTSESMPHDDCVFPSSLPPLHTAPRATLFSFPTLLTFALFFLCCFFEFLPPTFASKPISPFRDMTGKRSTWSTHPLGRTDRLRKSAPSAGVSRPPKSNLLSSSTNFDPLRHSLSSPKPDPSTPTSTGTTPRRPSPSPHRTPTSDSIPPVPRNERIMEPCSLMARGRPPCRSRTGIVGRTSEVEAATPIRPLDQP